MPLINLLTSPEPLRYSLFRYLRKIKNRVTNAPYLYPTVFSDVERPEYGYCIYHAAQLARGLGHDRVTIIEFGVAQGAGLINIEYHVQNIKKEIDIEFDVFGFDTGVGLSTPKDYRDLPYRWQEGTMKMVDPDALKEKLSFANLILGDVEDTVTSFFGDYSPGPVGAVFVDLDFYSSTQSALKIFDAPPAQYLPRVICYFDDILGTNEFVGELCAIKDFNETHQHKKIGNSYGLYALRKKLWCEKIFMFNDFEHPDYNKSYSMTASDGLSY